MSQQILFWVFSVISISGALLTFASSRSRNVGIGLWITGLAVGGIFLTLGIEILALMSWVLCTGLTAVYIYLSSVFGDHEGFPTLQSIGLAISAGVLLGMFILQGVIPKDWTWKTHSASRLSDFGKEYFSHRMLNVELIGLTLLLVIMGVGILLRPQEKV